MVTDALDLAAARVAASAAAAAPTPAARAEALTRLREIVRYGTGYSLPDGSTVRTWRACYRQWVPAPMGRPRSRLAITVAPDVRAWLEAQDGGPAATVERLVRAARAPMTLAETMTSDAVDPRLFRQEIMAEPPRTHEDFTCASCGKPVPVGDWPSVHEPMRSWWAGWPCCSDVCVRDMALAGMVPYHPDEHERAWMRRRLAADAARDAALLPAVTAESTPPATDTKGA